MGAYGDFDDNGVFIIFLILILLLLSGYDY